MTHRKTTNRLTQGQAFETRLWMQAHFEELKQGTRHDAALRASADLGFEIGFRSITKIAKEIGLVFVTKHPNRTKNAKPRKAKSSELHDLRMMCFCLASYLTKLFDGLGVEYSDDLRLMSDFKKMSDRKEPVQVQLL